MIRHPSTSFAVFGYQRQLAHLTMAPPQMTVWLLLLLLSRMPIECGVIRPPFRNERGVHFTLQPAQYQADNDMDVVVYIGDTQWVHWGYTDISTKRASVGS